MIASTILILIAPVAVALGVLLVFLGIGVLQAGGEMQQRMEMYNPTQPMTFEQRELRQPFSARVLRPMLLKLVRIFAWVLPHNRIADVTHRLQLAGNPSSVTTVDFVGVKGWTTILMAGIFALYVYASGSAVSPLMFLIGAVFTTIGFLLPDVWLSRQISKRQLALTNALPDALDMMTVAVEAGLSFEQAMGEIVNRWNDELAREFKRVPYEVGLGRTRREALEHLSERTGVNDISAFVTAVNHSEELGTSLGRVLTVQSQELRIKRRQRAQEAANKVPVKILFPMVFLIFPAVFAVILGPAIPRLIRSLGGL